MSGAEACLFGVAALAALVQATIGVGFALILAPVAAILRPDLLPGSLILLMIPLNIWVAWRERHAFDRFGVGWITAGRAAGTLSGFWILTLLSTRGLNLFVGISTLAAVAASLLAPSFRPGRGAFALAGLVTGTTETATGIGGPPLALVYQHEPAPVLRANLALCFLIGQVMSVALLAAAGALTREQWLGAFAGLPCLVFGVAFCGPARRRLDPRFLRRLVLGFAAISALVVMLRA